MPKSHLTTAQNAVDSILLDFENLGNVFNEISNGMAITDANATFLYVNPAFTEITGYSFDEAVGDNPGILHSGKHDIKFYKSMWDDIINKGRWQGEVWNRNKTGEVYPELLTITKVVTPTQNKTYYFSLFSDISFLKDDALKQYNLAFHDSLTLLPNRNLLKDRFQQAQNHLERIHHTKKLDSAPQIAISFLDLNKFKTINDTHGHFTGDQLLIHVAKTMQKCARKTDTISRFGGDEFVILFPEIKSIDEAINIIQRINKELKRPITINGAEITAELSAGIALYPKNAKDFDSIVSCADNAMYYAKKNKLGVTIYNDLPNNS